MATKDELEIELDTVKTELDSKNKEIDELKKQLEDKGTELENKQNELEEKEKEIDELKTPDKEELTPEELFKKKLDVIQEILGTVQSNPEQLQEEIKKRLATNNNGRLNKNDYIYLVFYHWDDNKDGKFSIGEIIKFFLKIREFLKKFKK